MPKKNIMSLILFSLGAIADLDLAVRSKNIKEDIMDICDILRHEAEYSTIQVEIFARRKFLPFTPTTLMGDFLCFVLMVAIFTTWAKIYSAKYFKGSWVGSNFCLYHMHEQSIVNFEICYNNIVLILGSEFTAASCCSYSYHYSHQLLFTLP